MVKILLLQQLYNLADDALEYQLLDRRSFPKRDEAEMVKEGTMPLGWKPHKRAQKDVDARWTKKHGKSHFGYKLMRKMAVTHAAVADTAVFESLLDRSNTSRDVYADRGYPTAEQEAKLKQAGWCVHIQRKGSATKGISDAQKKRNRQSLLSRGNSSSASDKYGEKVAKAAPFLVIFTLGTDLGCRAI